MDAHIMRTCDVSQMVCAFGDATVTGRTNLDVTKECAYNNVGYSVGCAHVDKHSMRTCDVSQIGCAFGDATVTGRAHLDDHKECT